MVPAPDGGSQPFISEPFLNHRPGRRVSYAGRAHCFIPGWATKQISGGMKPYSASAKASGNGRWVSGG
jgi:hypothetical protein